MLIWVFIYIHTLCMQAANILVGMPICADLPEKFQNLMYCMHGAL